MVRIFRLTLVFVCLATIQVRADRVVLTSGKVIEGRIISQTASQVKIKCKSGGSITYTKTIPAAQVKHIEKTIDRTKTKNEKPTSASGKATDKASKQQSLLNSATEAWLENDYRTASQSVTRLIRGASLSELDALSTESLAKLDMDIARLAASSRIAAAIDGNKGTNINLKNVTDYEAETLVRMLDQAIEEALVFDPVEHENDGGFLAYLLDQVHKVDWGLRAAGKDEPDEVDEPIEDVLADQNPPLKGPSPAGDTSKQVISGLLNSPTSYRADPQDARLMLRHVRTTSSLVHQKSKYDRSLRKNREAKKQTAQLRIALGEMSQQVQRAAGGRGSRGAAASNRSQERGQAQRQAKAQQQAEKDIRAKKAKRQKREGAAERFKPGGSNRSKRGRGR